MIFLPIVAWLSSEGFGAFKALPVVSPSGTWGLLIHPRVECGWALSQYKPSETELECSISAQPAAADLPSFFVPGLSDHLVCCRGFLLSFADMFDLRPFLWNRLVFQDNRSSFLLPCLLWLELLQPPQGGFCLIYSRILSQFIPACRSLTKPLSFSLYSVLDEYSPMCFFILPLRPPYYSTCVREWQTKVLSFMLMGWIGTFLDYPNVFNDPLSCLLSIFHVPSHYSFTLSEKTKYSIKNHFW